MNKKQSNPSKQHAETALIIYQGDLFAAEIESIFMDVSVLSDVILSAEKQWRSKQDATIRVFDISEFSEHQLQQIDLKKIPLRNVLRETPASLHPIINRAIAISNWDRFHRFSSFSGQPLSNGENRLTKIADERDHHPRIDPAVLVAVNYEDKLLLGRQSRWKENRYSIIAGYLEIGETLEECCHREVYEETGVEIESLAYFGSQPWPFPNNIMIGFTAIAKTTNITLHDGELEHANWFSADEVSKSDISLPSPYSLSAQMINAWLKN